MSYKVSDIWSRREGAKRELRACPPPAGAGSPQRGAEGGDEVPGRGPSSHKKFYAGSYYVAQSDSGTVFSLGKHCSPEHHIKIIFYVMVMRTFGTITFRPIALNHDAAVQYCNLTYDLFNKDSNVINYACCIEKNHNQPGYHVHHFVIVDNQRADSFKRKYSKKLHDIIEHVKGYEKLLKQVALRFSWSNKRADSPLTQYEYVIKDKDGTKELMYDTVKGDLELLQIDESTVVNTKVLFSRIMDQMEENISDYQDGKMTYRQYRLIARQVIPECKSLHEVGAVMRNLRDAFGMVRDQ